MNPVIYNCKSNSLETKRIGILEQEMKQIIPEVAIDHTGNIKKGIIHQEITSVLLQVNQEQQKFIEQLKVYVEICQNQAQ
jgi:hypothetical protein